MSQISIRARIIFPSLPVFCIESLDADNAHQWKLMHFRMKATHESSSDRCMEHLRYSLPTFELICQCEPSSCTRETYKTTFAPCGELSEQLDTDPILRIHMLSSILFCLFTLHRLSSIQSKRSMSVPIQTLLKLFNQNKQ